MKTLPLRALAASLACLAAPAAVWAQDGEIELDAAGDPGAVAEQAPAPEGPKILSGSLSVEFVTAYFKRGVLLEDQGLIAQPMLNLILGVYKSEEGPVDAAWLLAGTRQSIHGERTAETDSPEWWYEADIYGGFGVIFLDRLKFDTTYVAITSPNGAFDTIHELDFQLTFLDDGLLGDVTIHPYVLYVHEVHNSALAGPEAQYLELGLEPSFPLIKSQSFPVQLSFPVRVGISVDDYYQFPFGPATDDTVGFWSLGVAARMPLTFVPRDFGNVILTVGADYLTLGENNELINNGDENELIGRIGLSWAF